MAQLEAERRAVLQTAEDAVTKKVQQLLMLKGIGINKQLQGNLSRKGVVPIRGFISRNKFL